MPYGVTVKNLTLAKSVAATNAGANGLYLGTGFWHFVDNINIWDAPNGVTVGASATVIVTNVNVNWSSLCCSVPVVGFNLNGPSNVFSNIFAEREGSSASATGFAMAAGGTGLSDVWVNNAQADAVGTGFLIDVTACVAADPSNECATDIHITNPIINASGTGFSFVNLNSATESPNGPSVDIVGGSFLEGSGNAFTFTNSTTGYNIEHFNSQAGGVNTFINWTMPSAFFSIPACSAS